MTRHAGKGTGLRRDLLAIALAVAIPLAGQADADDLAEGFAEADVNVALDGDEYLAAVVTAFAARDTDRDGYLTPEELPEASAEALARIDRDGDGRI